MSHHLYEVHHGDGDKRETSARYKPDPAFVAATIAQHKAALRGRLAKSLRFAKGRGFNQPRPFQRKSCPV
jgi:hypothetical protein